MLLNIIDHIGVFVFAVSGILSASEKRLDLFGGVVLAFITALGGGTLRDLLLNTEVAWMKADTLIYTVLLGAIAGLIFHRRFAQWRRTFFIFDTIGIAVYTTLGLQKALNFDHLPVVAVFLGVISATFGGVIRDVLCNEIPLIFRKEFYATACLAGGFLYVIAVQWLKMETTIAMISCIGMVVVLRILAVKLKWQMPVIK